MKHPETERAYESFSNEELTAKIMALEATFQSIDPRTISEGEAHYLVKMYRAKAIAYLSKKISREDLKAIIYGDREYQFPYGDLDQ